MLAGILRFLTTTAGMHDNKNQRIMLGKYDFINSRVTPAFHHIVYLCVCSTIRCVLQAKCSQQAFSNMLALVLIIPCIIAGQFVLVENKWKVCG